VNFIRPGVPAVSITGQVKHIPAHWSYIAPPARPLVRALCAAFPARSPLLPALMRSLRAASVFPTPLLQLDKRARSGTLRLYYTSKQTVRQSQYAEPDVMGGRCARYCCATPFGTSVLSPRQDVVR
jgi:hypothetical protein